MSDGDGNPRITVNSSGNAGIGTVSPQAPLDFGVTSTNQQVLLLRQNGNSRTGLSVSNDYGVRVLAPHDIASTGSLFGVGKNNGTTYSGDLLTVQYGGNVGIGTTTPDEKLHVQGNLVVEGAGNAAGVYVMEKTIASSASQDIFTIANTNGAQVFQVMFNCSSTGYSVAKMFNVVHALGAGPVTNKTVDTGAYNTTEDFSVAFTDVTNTGVKCAITNNGTLSGTITITLILGGSPQAVTLTKH